MDNTNTTSYTQYSHIPYIPVTKTQQELEDAAQVKMEFGMPTTTVGEKIPAEDALTKNDIKLSKIMKMKLQHVGKVANDIELKTAATFENGEYVAPEQRDIDAQPYMKAAPKILVKPGTFEITDVHADEYVNAEGVTVDPTGRIIQSLKYNASGEVWAAQGEIAQVPPVPSMNAEAIELRTVKRHYRRGEVEYDPISQDNYLDRPGMEVNTADTFLGLPEEVEEEPTPEPEGGDEPLSEEE